MTEEEALSLIYRAVHAEHDQELRNIHALLRQCGDRTIPPRFLDWIATLSFLSRLQEMGNRDTPGEIGKALGVSDESIALILDKHDDTRHLVHFYETLVWDDAAYSFGRYRRRDSWGVHPAQGAAERVARMRFPDDQLDQMKFRLTWHRDARARMAAYHDQNQMLVALTCDDGYRWVTRLDPTSLVNAGVAEPLCPHCHTFFVAHELVRPPIDQAGILKIIALPAQRFSVFSTYLTGAGFMRALGAAPRWRDYSSGIAKVLVAPTAIESVGVLARIGSFGGVLRAAQDLGGMRPDLLKPGHGIMTLALQSGRRF